MWLVRLSVAKFPAARPYTLSVNDLPTPTCGFKNAIPADKMQW